MSSQSATGTGVAPRPLRLWPGVVAAVALLLFRFGLPVVWPEQTATGVLGGIAGGLLILVWWAFFSRAPRSDRWGTIAMIVVALAGTWTLVDVSISTGAMGGLLPMLAIPPLGVALVVWAAASRNLAAGARRATMAATIVIACGVWTLAKTGGFSSDFDNDLMWRWAPSPEDRLLVDASAALPAAETTAELPRGIGAAAPASTPEAEIKTEVPRPDARPGTPEFPPVASSSAPEEGMDPAQHARSEWPGFRGALRDGIVRGVRIETDWAAHPPIELWRRPIGPGWSSFAVHGDRFYTQEQRGEDEIVASYSLTTGKPLWSHRDATRFWESNGGAGPRGTPTLSDGRVYTFGATGILNALDARSGALLWSHNVASDTHTQTPMWGFASSPVVVDGLVIVAASGTLAAYDAATGQARWVGPRPSLSSGSYSSPQRVTIDGVEQIVLLSEAGATGVAAADGKVLWEHGMLGGPILQPAVTEDGDLVIHQMALDGGMGIRRLAITRRPAGWTAEERWTSNALKSMSSDFVIHKGHAFGFDGSILACIDLEGGARKWKGGRYGSGQLILLADQGVLVVVTEEGELALVSATPDKFTEIATVPAIEGKTWNHPVLVGDTLLVRNGEEMAAFRLSTQGR
jgi:outer membrane protein assembly factor BamB